MKINNEKEKSSALDMLIDRLSKNLEKVFNGKGRGFFLMFTDTTEGRSLMLGDRRALLRAFRTLLDNDPDFLSILQESMNEHNKSKEDDK